MIHIPYVLFRRMARPDSTKYHQHEKECIQRHSAGSHPRLEVAEIAPGQRRLEDLALPHPSVTVIIPTRDRVDLLQVVCEGLWTQTDYPAIIETLIIDNGSVASDTKVFLNEAQKQPYVQVLHRKGPFNFSRLNNEAAQKANGEVLVFLNNDVEIINAKWLDELAPLATRPDVGAVGALLLYPDDHIQHAGVQLGGDGGIAAHIGRGRPLRWLEESGLSQAVRLVRAVTAACMAVRRSIFFEVGAFDEKLAVTYNDVDFCLRLREYGYRVLFTPFAQLYHQESASRGSDRQPENRRRALKEHDYLVRKWGNTLAPDAEDQPELTADEPRVS